MNVKEVFHSRYELLEKIGTGGFSEVWKALDMRSGIIIAIKIFRKQDEEGITLCREEYLKTFELNHAHILTPFHFDVDDDRPYLVMKFLSGGTLAQQFGTISTPEIWKLIAQLSSALEYLHTLSEPIIHGDIKPDNILIDESGNYYLTDFGISTKLKNKFTQTMLVDPDRDSGKGITPMAYRAPETFKYRDWEMRDPSSRTDIWSAGVVLYQTIYNTMPFNGEGGLGQLILMKSGNHSLEEVLDLGNDTIDAFNDIILSTLQLDPNDRTPILEKTLERIKQPIEKATSSHIAHDVTTSNDILLPSDKTHEKNEERNKKLIYFFLLVFVMISIFFGYALINNREASTIILAQYQGNDFDEEAEDNHDLSLAPLEKNSSVTESETSISSPTIGEIPKTSSTSITQDRNQGTTANKTAPTINQGDPLSKVESSTTLAALTTNIPEQESAITENKIPAETPKEKDMNEAKSDHPASEATKTTISTSTATIKPNIPIPLALNEDIRDASSYKSGSYIPFVVVSDVEAYGDVFLRKGQIVQAVVKKVSKDKINIRFPEIYSSGGTKLKGLNLDNFEIIVGKDQKGKIFRPVTSSYQQNVLIK
ncbi:MAG: protein kinase [Chitinophagales bacterium]|nr:protein kinase [Chitinophagales bacterium]